MLVSALGQRRISPLLPSATPPHTLPSPTSTPSAGALATQALASNCPTSTRPSSSLSVSLTTNSSSSSFSKPNPVHHFRAYTRGAPFVLSKVSWVIHVSSRSRCGCTLKSACSAPRVVCVSSPLSSLVVVEALPLDRWNHAFRAPRLLRIGARGSQLCNLQQAVDSSLPRLHAVVQQYARGLMSFPSLVEFLRHFGLRGLLLSPSPSAAAGRRGLASCTSIGPRARALPGPKVAVLPYSCFLCPKHLSRPLPLCSGGQCNRPGQIRSGRRPGRRWEVVILSHFVASCARAWLVPPASLAAVALLLLLPVGLSADYGGAEAIHPVDFAACGHTQSSSYLPLSFLSLSVYLCSLFFSPPSIVSRNLTLFGLYHPPAR